MAEWWEPYEEQKPSQKKANEEYWQKRLKDQPVLKNPPERSMWKRFIEGIDEFIRHDSPAASIARRVAPLVETGDGTTPQQRRQRVVTKERDHREVRANRDPANSLGDHLVDFAATAVGSAISDPTTFVGGIGKNAGEKLINVAGVNAAADVALQGAEVAEGVRDEYDPVQGATNVAIPFAIHGAVKGAKAGGKALKEGTTRAHAYAARKARGDDFIMPVEGRITSGVGRRKAPKAGASTNHGGIDIAARVGTPVMASAEGRVSNVGRNHGKRGNWVEIDYGNGYTSRYLHLSGFNKKIGDTVKPGEFFARTGKSGNVTGPHLHWSMMKDGKVIDPRSAKFGERGPEDLGDVRIVQDELPPVEEMARVNAALAPRDEPVIDLIARADDSDSRFANITDKTRYKEIEEELTQTQKDFDAGKITEEQFNSKFGELIPEFTRLQDPLTRGTNVVPIGQKDPLVELEKILNDVRNKDVLTPAERQEMDASVTGRPPAENTGYEKFTPNMEPKAPANDPTLGAAIKGFAKNILEDERGSYRDGPLDDEPKMPDGSEAPDIVKKLTAALKAAQPLPAKQRIEYRKERKARLAKMAQTQKFTSGEKGFFAEKAQLGGEMPKVDFEGIRNQFEQKDIDQLFDMIKNSPKLDLFEQVNARDGLLKILGAYGGKVPTNSELKLLAEVFPDETIGALLKNRPWAKKFWGVVANTLNVPRAMMATLDLSAPLRQGIFMIGRPQFYSSFFKMFHTFGSEKAYQAMMEEIKARPTYKMMKEANLQLTDVGKFLDKREEDFMTDYAERFFNLPKKIPGVGKAMPNPVRASSRAYAGFLTKLRADVFDSFIKDGNKLGIDWANDEKALKAIASYINGATGRGNLWKLNQAAPLLNVAFFSPRLIASRLQMTVANPVRVFLPESMGGLHPIVRKAYLRDLASFSAVASTALGLAQQAGFEVEWDMRSTDFGKIKHGNTRYDVLGGFGQYMRLFAQITTNKTKNSKGELKKLGDPDEYKADTRLDKRQDFFRSKEAPIPATVDNFLDGKNIIGEPFEMTEEAKKMFTPFIIQGAQEAIEEYGPNGILTQIPAIFGVGVQTYDANKNTSKKPKKESGDWWEEVEGNSSSSSGDDWWSEFE